MPVDDQGAAVGVAVVPVSHEQRPLLERLLQLHLYEMGLEPGADGTVDFGEPLEGYLGSDRAAAYVLTHGGQTVVGFALVKLD